MVRILDLTTCLVGSVRWDGHCDARPIDGPNIAEASSQSKPAGGIYQLATDARSIDVSLRYRTYLCRRSRMGRNFTLKQAVSGTDRYARATDERPAAKLNVSAAFSYDVNICNNQKRRRCQCWVISLRKSTWQTRAADHV